MRTRIGCCLAIVPCIVFRVLKSHPPLPSSRCLHGCNVRHHHSNKGSVVRTLVDSRIFDVVSEVVAGGLRCLQTAPSATSRLSRLIGASLEWPRSAGRAAWCGRHVIPRSIDVVVHAVKPGLKAAVCEALWLGKGCLSCSIEGKESMAMLLTTNANFRWIKIIMTCGTGKTEHTICVEQKL